MGKVVPLRRFQKPRPRGRRPFRMPPVLSLLALFAIGGGVAAWQGLGLTLPTEDAIACRNPRVIDGDTFDCGGTRIRLAGIDAPEMPGHCREGRECTPGDPYAARRHLVALTRGAVSCRRVDTDVYGRTVARCETGDGNDVSCAMIADGHAVHRYRTLWCF